MLKKNNLIVLALCLVVSFSSIACRKGNNTDPDVKPTPSGSSPNPNPSDSSPPIPNPTSSPNGEPDNKSISLFFNNAYKGLVTENTEVIKNDPNSPYKAFISLIDSAKTKIDMSIYDLNDPEIAQAFINAHKKGIKVRLVTDTDNANKAGMKAIKEAGLPVVEDNRSAIMHDKFMIVDGQQVWSGSMNLTSSSLYEHNNVSILYNSTPLATIFTNEFNDMFEKKIFNGSNHTGINPSDVGVESASVRTFFSPKGGTKNAIALELQKATKSIKVMAFSFTDKDIAQIMVNKKANNLDVQGVLDGCEMSSQYSVYRTLKDAKVEVYRDGNQALMHEKNFIIDDNIVITGSYNFSANADKNNNENCMIIKSPDIAKVFNQEFERLKKASKTNTNLPPYNSPACGGNN